MSLIANLFAPATSLKPSSYTPPAASSSTPDNPPSFSDALDSALQPQRSPAPPPSTATAAQPDSKPQHSDKKAADNDDSSDDQHTATDDSTTPDAPTAQTLSAPAQSAEPTLAKKLPAAKDAQDPAGPPADPSADPTAQQIIAVASAQLQTQPLPLNRAVSLLSTANAGVLAAGQPVPAVPQPPQNKVGQPSKPAQPAAPAPQADVAQTQADAAKIPTPADSPKTTDAPASPIKPSLKRAIESQHPAIATPAKPADRPVTTADSTPNSDTPTTPAPASDPTAPSSLATQQTNPKFATNAAHATQSPDSAISQSSSPAPSPAPSQPATPDATLIAESVKALATAPTSDDSTPAPQTTATPLHTLTSNANNPIDNSASSAAPAQDSPRLEPDQTFDQIVLGLRTKMDATHSNAEISLNPPNLGTLHVSVSMQNGSLTAQFQSSSEVVRDLLKGNMEKLKSVLESQGVTVDNLAVGAPQDKTELPSAAPATAQTNQSANDGRSAGQYNRDPQNRKRSQDPGAFAKTWQPANAKAPIDLVA